MKTLPVPFLAMSNPELVGTIGVVAMLVGVWLNWHRQHHIEEIEEHVKNGKLTTDQAWWRMRIVNWRAQAVVFVGTALLVLAVFEAMD